MSNKLSPSQTSIFMVFHFQWERNVCFISMFSHENISGYNAPSYSNWGARSAEYALCGAVGALGEILKLSPDKGPWVKCPTGFSDPTSLGLLLYYYYQPCVVQKWQEVILFSAHIIFAESCMTVARVSMSEPPYWQNRGVVGQNEEKWVRSLDGRRGGREEGRFRAWNTQVN